MIASGSLPTNRQVADRNRWHGYDIRLDVDTTTFVAMMRCGHRRSWMFSNMELFHVIDIWLPLTMGRPCYCVHREDADPLTPCGTPAVTGIERQRDFSTNVMLRWPCGARQTLNIEEDLTPLGLAELVHDFMVQVNACPRCYAHHARK